MRHMLEASGSIETLVLSSLEAYMLPVAQSLGKSFPSPS